jgi:hypothetical protein
LITGWAWDVGQATWEEGYSRLRAFVEREGHARVAQRVKDDGFGLGAWVATQRSAHASGRLTAARQRRLEALPGWTWDPYRDDWEEGFAHLERFVQRAGHARVPSGHREDGFNLATWVSGQRQAFKTGTLDPARAARLEALSGWVWRIADAAWDDAYERLERYVEREGHAQVPRAFNDDRFQLGAWVGYQRQLYRRGGLTLSRRRRLESLPGWLWDPLTAKWEASFSRLRSYVARVGDARVPHRYAEDGEKLGQWVMLQRLAFNRGALDPTRARRLEALPGWVWEAPKR